MFNREDTILLFLGTPRQTIDEHFNEIKKYQTEKDWTYDRSDEHILEHSKYWINKSKEYEKECRLDHFHHAISTEILLKDQVISNILCKPNGLLLYVGKWYIISLDVLSQIFGDDLRVGVIV